MEKKSLGVNFIFNMLKTLMGVVFPLITFPYATRVLGPEYLGKIDYAQANVTYFTLIAAFGITSYAVREGARIRDDKEKMNGFVGEILAINLVTVGIAYGLFFLALLIPKFEAYKGIMLVFSSTIILTAFGMEWVFNIYEDYKYITIRSFLFQVISIVVLFTCVKSYKDYLIYVLVLITSSVGSNVMNLIRAKKYIRFNIKFSKNLGYHIKPMFMIFIMNLASSIYLIMDRSMLGSITGDDIEVGLYATANKIIAVLVSIFTALRMVMTPRVSYHMKDDEKKAEELNTLTGKLMIMFGIPAAVGLFCLSDRVIVLFAGAEYIGAALTLRILLVDLVIAVLNGFLVNQLFIVHRRDKWASTVVVVGAVVNLIMNAITIPFYGKEGAAVSTCIAEFSIFVVACVLASKIFDLKSFIPQIIQSVLACIPMMGLFVWFAGMNISDLWIIIATIVTGAFSYFVLLFLLKNELVKMGINFVKGKLSNRG